MTRWGTSVSGSTKELIIPLDYLEPDCLWERMVLLCTGLPTVQAKLPGDYLYSLVYIMRDGSSSAWRDFETELNTRIEIPAPEDGPAPVRKRQHGPLPDEKGFRATLKIISSYESNSWEEEENLAKVCKELDKKKVKRSGGNRDFTWTQSFETKDFDGLRRDISYRLRKARELPSSPS